MIEWHTDNAYPLYSAEADARWQSYPGYTGGTPHLWVDGVDCGYNQPAWAGIISDAMRVPSSVGLTHIGTTYDPAMRTGEVQVECYNSGVDAIDAAVQVVITEDSINYPSPNGDQWHNHVCRDYVPDNSGTPVTLPAGGYDTVTVSYALQPSWVEERVNLVVYLQNLTTKSCYQGSVDNLLNLTGVEESKLLAARDLRVQVSPNPCRTGCEFALSGAAARDARITVYTPDGRLVSSLQTAANRASWSRAGVSRGIYLYRVNAGTATAEGKLVVAD